MDWSISKTSLIIIKDKLTLRRKQSW